MKPINVKMTAKPLTYDELRDAVKLHPYLDSRFSVVSYLLGRQGCVTVADWENINSLYVEQIVDA